jgi:hypothetical protein
MLHVCPKRISSWEIYPVYAFDVCKQPGGECDPNSDFGWESVRDAVREEPRMARRTIVLIMTIPFATDGRISDCR